mgnify:CR=1 FL=1|jgi:hypothetical protein
MKNCFILLALVVATVGLSRSGVDARRLGRYFGTCYRWRNGICIATTVPNCRKWKLGVCLESMDELEETEDTLDTVLPVPGNRYSIFDELEETEDDTLEVFDQMEQSRRLRQYSHLGVGLSRRLRRKKKACWSVRGCLLRDSPLYRRNYPACMKRRDACLSKCGNWRCRKRCTRC